MRGPRNLDEIEVEIEPFEKDKDKDEKRAGIRALSAQQAAKLIQSNLEIRCTRVTSREGMHDCCMNNP